MSYTANGFRPKQKPQHRAHSVAARQSHDLIGAHRHIAATAQMRDDTCAPPAPFARLGTYDPHGLAVEREFDFRLRQQTGPFANVNRNGHLPLGCDAQLPLGTGMTQAGLVC